VPTDPVVLSGSGWKPNEDVYLYAVDSETQAWTYGSTVAADASGAFSVNPYFIVQLAQDGVSFSVTAVGAQSAMQADVKFTDSTFNSLTLGSQTGTATFGAAAMPTYLVTAGFQSSPGSNTVTFSITWSGGTPTGVTTGFSPPSVTEPANTTGTMTSTLTVTTSATTPVGTYSFTVTGTPSSGGARTANGTLTVQAGPAAKLALSGSTADLASGSTRTLTATIQDTNGNTVTTGPDSTLSVTFAKTSGTGSVTGLGSSTAVGGVATLTVTGGLAGSVTITASATRWRVV
jgi:hypothetical protein